MLATTDLTKPERPYFTWRDGPKTWMARWICANRAYWLYTGVTKTKKYRRILEEMPVELVFGCAEQVDVSNIRYCCESLTKQYYKAVARLNGNGELTERERKNPNITSVWGRIQAFRDLF